MGHKKEIKIFICKSLIYNNSHLNYTLPLLILLLFFNSCRFINKPSDLNIENSGSVEYIGIFGDDTVEITKENASWVLNGNYEADPVAVDNLLYAFQNLEIIGASSRKSADSLGSRKIIIETSKKTKKYRYYHGPNTAILHHEGSSTVFRVRIKGSPGVDLQQVFSDNPGYWRKRLIINIDPGELREITVKPGKSLGRGFSLVKDSTTFHLYDAEGNEIEWNKVDQEKILLYISYLEEIFYEAEIKEDSIINRISSSDPFYRFLIEKKNAESINAEVYPIYTEAEGKDLFYGALKMQCRNRVLKINYAYLDVLFQDLDYFTVE